MKRLLAALGLLCACARELDLPAPVAPVPDSLDGRVTIEEPGSGRTLPAPGARVEVAGTGVAVAADEHGLFSIAAPPPAPRALLITWASAAGGAVDRQTLFRTSALNGSGAIHLGDVQLGGNAQVLGRVLLADKADSAPDQAGTVVFVPRFPYATITGEGGAFLLPHLPAGRISLAFYRSGYLISGVEGVDLASGAQLTLQAVPLQAQAGAPTTGGLAGKAFRPDGSAAAGAQVTATPALGGAAKTGTVGSDGAFGFEGLAVGPWVVSLTDAAAGTSAQLGGVLVAPAAAGAAPADVGSLTLSKTPPPPVVTGTAPAAPVARPGADLFSAPGAAVRLDGSTSDGAALVYSWSADSAGVSFSVNDSKSPVTSFVTPNAATPITITLRVTDGFGQKSAPATLRLYVDHPPVALLTAPATTRSNTPTVLDAATSSDADAADLLTYSFVVSAAPPGAQVTFNSGAVPSQKKFSASAEGSYQFQVIVDDGHLSAISPPVPVTVSDQNHAPVAVISAPAQVDQNTDVPLDGSGSLDPDPGDNAGLTFAWSVISGPPISSGATATVAHVIAPGAAGTISYKLVVTDAHGLASAAATVTVGVRAAPPPPPPPVAAVAVTNPANGAGSVPTTQLLEIDYTGSLDSSSVQPGSVTLLAGSTPIAGTPSYAELSGRHALLFRPAVPMPSLTPMTVQVGVLKDLLARNTAAYSFGFTTNVASWSDISPNDPIRTAAYSGAPDGSAHFSEIGLAPALATGPSGSYLLGVELGNGPLGPGYPASGNANYGGLARHWDLGQPDAGTYDGGLNWNIAVSLTQNLTAVNGCCNAFGVAGANHTDGPWWHSSLGFDTQGQPIAGFDFGDNNWLYGSVSTTNRVQVTRTIGSSANDGVNSWVAFRGCDCYLPDGGSSGCGSAGNVAVTELYIMPYNSTTVAVGQPVALAVTPQPAQISCSNQYPSSYDIYMGPPALAGGGGKLWVLVAVKPGSAQPYALSLWSRSAGDTALPLGAPITDPNHASARLNVLPMSWQNQVAAAFSPLGPLLLWTEGSGSGTQLRASRYDLNTLKFVDPLTGVPGADGTSVVSPVLLDGSAFTVPNGVALTLFGSTPFVAFQALSSSFTGHRIFVAHADVAQGKWVLDPDVRNADGALNAHPGCDASPPSMALVDGYPAVAWGEQCAIPSAQNGYTANYLLVRRLQ